MLKRSIRPVILVAALAALSLVAAAPSYATLGAPVGFNTSTGAPVPAFGWNAVSGADHYEFQISGAQGFNAPLEDITNIKNTRVTLDKSIPDCNCTWRVRALTSGNVAGPWSAAVDYDKTTPLVTTDTPADGDTVTYPTPIVLTWEPLEGASKYEVLIGDSPTFAGVTAKETSASFYVPPTWLAPGTHYWAVAPKDADGNVGSYTVAQSFDWTWPNTVNNLTVTDSVDNTGNPDIDAAIFEPRFSWDAVPGAARYEIEINTDSNWASGSIAFDEDTVLGTTISPDVLLPNGDYYWRVRAFDPSGFAGDWSYGGDQPNPGDTFNQTYDNSNPTVPNLHMRDLTDPGTDIDGGTAGYQTDTPIISWDPVPGASYYDVELHPFLTGACQWALGPTQSSLVYQDKTTSTSWTPMGTSPGGNPVAGQSAANDGFSTKLVAGTSYCVRVRPERDGKVAAQWTVLDPTGDQFAFQFTSYPLNGNPCSPSCQNSNYLGSDDYLEPQSGVTESNTPLFTWNPIQGMKSYFIVVSTDPTFSSGYVDYAFTQVNAYAPRTSSSYKAYADFAVPLYWQVLPSDQLNGSTANGFAGLGAHAMFHKQTVAPLNLAPADGADQTGRPTFEWTPVPGARDYHIQIADDPGFGAGHVKEDIGSSSGGTYPTTYTSLNNAFAQGNYWWRVQPYDQAGHALAWSTPTKFVQKYDAPTFATVTNPTQGAMIPVLQWDPMPGAVGYDVHLVCSGQGASCTDGSNIQSTAAPIVKLTGLGPIGYQIRGLFKNASGNPTPGPYTAVQTFSRTIPPPANMVELATANTLLFSWDGRAGADRYSVQVSRNTSFATVTESYDTRFTSYAPRLSASDFTNGGGFYWRVAAKDGDGNLGQWSNPMAIALPLKISASASPSSIHKGVYSTVTVTVKDYGGTVVAGASVKLAGAGISPAPKKTTTAGKAVFKIKPTKTGKITVTVTKTNCKTTTTSVTVS